MTTDTRRAATTAKSPGVPSRLGTPAGLAMAAAALITLIMALIYGGGRPHAAAPGLPDPGPITGWGLPVTKLILDAAALGTLGALLLGVLLAPGRKPGKGEDRDTGEVLLSNTGLRCVRAAGVWATVWAAAAAAMLVFTASDVMGVPLGDTLTGNVMGTFVNDTQQGRAYLVVVMLAVLLAGTAFFTLTVNGGVLLLLVTLAALIPPLLTGHSAASGDHDIATSSLLVHVIAVSLWVGGLLGLVIHGRRSRVVLATAVPRFSQLALVCYIAVGVSGVINAWVNMGGPEQLWRSHYGGLVLGKVAALVVLGWFGHKQRERLVPRVVAQRSQRAFLRMAATEAGVMLATVGLAVALGRTPTPVLDKAPSVPTAARGLLGYDVPPISVRTILLDWRPDSVVLVVAALAAGLYIAGVRRLGRAGVRWPLGRTVAWLGGVLVAVFVLCGGLSTYGSALFSAHMVQHMVLTMLVPILLALGGPVTLALRALPAARRGEPRGVREWILAVIHSTPVRVLTHPLVALTLYVITLYAFYYSPLFELSLRSHTAHLLMHAHFVAVGSLYFWPIVGIDPLPRRLPHFGRMLLLFASMPFHAFFGVVMMTSDTLFAGDWFRDLALPWVDRLADQRVGGGIAWAFGEIPAVFVLAALFVQWYRADERQARREDRRADADGDAALTDYNDRLRALNARDG